MGMALLLFIIIINLFRGDQCLFICIMTRAFSLIYFVGESFKFSNFSSFLYVHVQPNVHVCSNCVF